MPSHQERVRRNYEDKPKNNTQHEFVHSDYCIKCGCWHTTIASLRPCPGKQIAPAKK